MEASASGLTPVPRWLSRVSGWLAKLGDVLLKAELLWVVPALAFTYTTLLWGLGFSWLGLVLAATAFPLRRWRLGYFGRRTPFDTPCAAFMAATLLALTISPSRGLSFGAFQSAVACVLLYYSLVNTPYPALIKCGFAFAVVGVFVAGLVAFRDGFSPPSMVAGFGTWVQRALEQLPQAPRVSSIANPIMSTAHGLAVALEMVLLPLIGLVLFVPKLPSKAIALVASLPLLTLLVLLGSQGAWLALFSGAALLAAWRSRWGMPLVVVAVALGYLGYRQGWIDLHPMVSQFGPPQSLASRMELWRGAIDVIRHHPIAGCGLGCLGRYSTTSCLSPHNAYLQLYADMGIVGTLALLGALVVGGRMAIDLLKASRADPWYGFAAGIVAAAVAVAVHGVFEGSPSGIIAETADGYLYTVSPVFAILAGLFARTVGIIEGSRHSAHSHGG